MANELPPGSMPPPATGGTPPGVNPPPPPPPPGPGTPPGGPVIIVGPGPAPPTANTPPATATDVNAAANNVVEGAAVNTLVGVTVRSTDAEGQTITYTLASDSSGGGFKIDAATGVVTVADPAKINFETAAGHAYTITVNSFDGFSTSSQSFTINVSDIAPSTPVDSNAGANTVAEGAAANTLVGITASSTDINGPGVTYSLSNSANGAFKIDAATGVVSVADPTKIDFESTAPGHVLNITAVASDGTLSSSQNFAINVTDVALATPVDNNGAANSVAEGAANGSTVGLTAFAVDPNGPATTYSLIGDTSGGGFTINATTGIVTVADGTRIDFESAPGNAYSVTVQAANGVSTTTQSFTIGVTDVAPAAPTDSDAAANSVLEGVANGTAVGITAASSDINGGPVTFSLVGDTSGGGFTIDAATGIVTVADSSRIDFETAAGNAYTVTAQASDGTLTSSQTFTIGVTNIAPSIPVDTNAGANSVIEGAANGSTVGITASATDINGPGVLWSLADSAGGRFTIDATTGVVTVANSSAIDFESAPGNLYTIVARATDSGGLFSQQSFTIAVTDAAPSTPVDGNAAANTIAEGAANGSTVGVTASSTDVNGPGVTYSLVGDTSGGGFTINTATGVVTVADATRIDFETSGASYTVVVQASDGTLASSQAFVIAVSDIAPSTPVDSNAAANQVAVGAAAGATVGVTASSTDVNGPAVTYSLVNDTSNGGFTINAATGVVTVADPSKILLADPSYDITVDSSDGTLHSQQTFTVNVVVDIAPTVAAGDTLNYTENATSIVDPTITITDPDNATMAGARVAITGGFNNTQDVLSFTPVGFITGTYDPVTGVLTLTGTDTQANYELALESVTYQNTSDNPTTAPRTLSYTVSDGTLDSAAATATINVAAVNDVPVVTPTGGSTAYTENAAAVVIDGALTVTDPDSQIASAQVRLSVGFQNGDQLNFTDQNGITGIYNSGTGVLALSGTASVADYQAALRSITFNSTNDDPGVSKTIEFKVNDTVVDSNLATRTLAITPVNDEPTLTTSGLNPGFTENGAAVDLFSTPVVASAIEAAQNLNSLVVTVSNVAGTGASESLTIDGTTVELNNGNSETTATNGMTASVALAGGTATVTISKVGGVSAAIMQSIVDGLAYGNISEDPGAATRVVTLTSLSDTGPTGGANDNTAAPGIASSVAVTPVNDAPVIDLVAGGGVDNTATTATFSEGAGPPSTTVFVMPNLDLNDVDSGNLTGATVTVTDFVGGQDVLTVSGSTSGSVGGVGFSVSGNVITFSGTASVAAYEAAIQAVQYNNSSENPAPGTRHFNVQVTDGANASTTATATLNVAAQDDAPVNTIPTDAAVPTAFSNTDTAISGLSITDVDAGAGLVTTQLSVTNGTVAVTLAGAATISGGANGSATLTLSGTVADINATLANNVNFHSTDGFTGQANLTVVTHDGGNTGAGGPLTDTDTVHIGVVPQVWFIDNTNFAANGAGGTGTAADPFRSISDFNGSAGPGANDYVVIKTGTGTYTGDGINLQNGQQLYGAGETLSFTNPVNGNVVQILDGTGTRPTINVTTGGDQGIDLASGNTIHGVNITTAAGTTGLDDGNNSVGTLTIDHMSITGAGQAVDIDQGGNLNVALESVSSTGGTFGVQLAGTGAALTGSFSATGGAISGSSSSGFLVGDGAGGASTGGTAAISYGGTISAANAASVVNIQDHSTGAVTLSGNLTHTGAGAGIVLDDNSSNFTFSGATLNLNTGSSTAINITDQTNSTVLFSGATVNIDTTTGAGINIGGTNNNGNFNITGGTLTIDATGAGNGFAATGGGTVNITGANNHIATVGGTALNITSTTIGASNVTFHDISANGGTNGIVLNNTGSSGGLTVTGTGSTDGTGGTIQNTTGRGASFINTSNVSLSNMNLTNAGTSDLDADNSGLSTGDNLATNAAIHLQTVTNATIDNVNISGGAEQGINGNTVANFNLSNSSISNVGNAADEDGIHFFNMSGTSAITNTTITGSFDDHLNLQTQSGNLDLTISGGSVSASTQGSGYLFGIRGTTVANINIDGASSTNNFSGGIVADAFDSSTMNLRVNNSTSSGNNDQLSVSAGDSSSVDLEATGNTLSSVAAGDFVVIGLLGSAFDTGYVFDARIHNNTISVADELAADGVFVFNAGGGVINAAITDNTINYAGGQRAIIVQQGQDGAATTRATITGNNIDLLLNGGNNADNAIVGTSGVADPSGAGSFLDLNIGGAGALANDITHSLGGTVGAGGDIRVRQRFADNINLDGYAGGSTDTAAVIAYLNSRNNEVDTASATVDGGSYSGNASPAFISVSVSTPSVLEDGGTNLVYTLTRSGSTASSLVANFAITGTASATSDYAVTGATTFTAGTGLGTVTFAAGSATAVITVNPTADADATESNESVVLDVGNSGTANGSFARGVITDDAPLLAAAGGVQSSTPTPGETHLTQAQLNSVIAAAIAQWAHAGATPAQLAALAAITFTVADLAGNAVGLHTGGDILIDANAAGHGWFVDSTPSDSFEFTHAENAGGTDLSADPSSAAAGHIDLLTAVMHEMGHELGLSDLTAAADAHNLMYSNLVDGERRLPDAIDVALAPTTTLTPTISLGPVTTTASSAAAANAGNDTIDAGHGGGFLFGGGGADTFAFANVDVHAATAPPVTHVVDYSYAEGDRFDFSALTSQFHASGFSDGMIVRAVEDGSGQFATLQVNANDPYGPPAAANWVSVAQIDGAHSGDALNVLIDSHSGVHLTQLHVGLLT
ncbi:cadherin domain-containing protein [Bradyrhizobium sp. AUGA SZCCT0222]|uniref:beta strand repeat-containing protein n=1 Tax=Bradyrhizobium sp. AUGA SZCCT0222 TaxID=2807668 RepID=UPI001BA94EA4|nr:cadherin repeat domain-containing protein [Bradyrhizobium sp. AUGA SZCCT0222]MBR1266842.1 cadherin domain-containing protein [Bradyrhizobium sp. AUGA SZCCT0222]